MAEPSGDEAVEGRAIAGTARQAETAVAAQSAERLRDAVAHAPIVIFAVDRHGVFTMSEGKGLEALGLRPGGHVGQSYFVLYGHLPESVAAMKRALNGEAATTLDEYRGIVFETRWTPALDARGAVTGVIGVSADVTERRRLERRTHEALHALLAMAEALVQGGDEVPSGAEGMAGETEAVAQRLVTLTRSVLGCTRVSMTLRDAETGTTRPLAVVGARPEEEQLWRSGQPGAALREYLGAVQLERLLAEDILILDAAESPGRPLPYGIRTLLLAVMRAGARVVGILSLDHGGAPHAYTADEVALARAVARLSGLVIGRERLVHEREEARATEAALRETNRRMDEFLGIASHELRTPLTGLRGSLQVLQRRFGRAVSMSASPAADLESAVGRLSPFLDRAIHQSRALAGLVDDLLDLSRIQAGQLQLRLVPCDLIDLVEQSVEEQRALAPARRIDLRRPARSPVFVNADAERLSQVVANYLSNALKYSAEEQPVSVGVAADGATARVWVRDEGPGIPVSDQQRVWDRFYRVEGAGHRSGSSVGLGLGLYISHSIIERHHGQVGVESIPGRGATFWLTLPLLNPVGSAES